MKKIFYLLLVGAFVISCKKAGNPPPTPPVISFVSFTTSSPTLAKLTIHFTDEDGDIGLDANLQDSSNYDFYMRYYYKDTSGKYVPFYYHFSNQPVDPVRDSTIYPYHIPYVTDNIRSKILDGQIIIDLHGYAPSKNSPFNDFKFTFWIYDRAHHKSNVVATPAFQTHY